MLLFEWCVIMQKKCPLVCEYRNFVLFFKLAHFKYVQENDYTSKFKWNVDSNEFDGIMKTKGKINPLAHAADVQATE